MDQENLLSWFEAMQQELEQLKDASDVQQYRHMHLHVASEKGQAAIVQALLDRGAHVDAVNDAGETPLFRATMAGRRDVVALLVDKGAEIDFQNRGGWTPLFAAIQLRRAEGVALLLEAGANIDIQHRNVRPPLTPLHFAASEGHGEIVRLLLDHHGRSNRFSREISLGNHMSESSVAMILDGIVESENQSIERLSMVGFGFNQATLASLYKLLCSTTGVKVLDLSGTSYFAPTAIAKLGKGMVDNTGLRELRIGGRYLWVPFAPIYDALTKNSTLDCLCITPTFQGGEIDRAKELIAFVPKMLAPRRLEIQGAGFFKPEDESNLLAALEKNFVLQEFAANEQWSASFQEKSSYFMLRNKLIPLNPQLKSLSFWSPLLAKLANKQTKGGTSALFSTLTNDKHVGGWVSNLEMGKKKKPAATEQNEGSPSSS